MKSYFIFLLFIFIAFLSNCYADFGSSNTLKKSKRSNEFQSVGIQNGSDVVIVGKGDLEVFLTNNSELVFEFCPQKCEDAE